jgi:hypothetical protein
MAETRQEVAARKRARAKQLIDAGKQPKPVMAAIKNEFGSGINGTVIYALYHKKHGTTPHPTRGKYQRKKKKKVTGKLAVVPKRIEPLDVVVPTAAPARAVDTLLSALLRAMRAEGVDSVMIRADGRATVYHVVSREVQIS